MTLRARSSVSLDAEKRGSADAASFMAAQVTLIGGVLRNHTANEKRLRILLNNWSGGL